MDKTVRYAFLAASAAAVLIVGHRLYEGHKQNRQNRRRAEITQGLLDAVRNADVEKMQFWVQEDKTSGMQSVLNDRYSTSQTGERRLVNQVLHEVHESLASLGNAEFCQAYMEARGTDTKSAIFHTIDTLHIGRKYEVLANYIQDPKVGQVFFDMQKNSGGYGKLGQILKSKDAAVIELAKQHIKAFDYPKNVSQIAKKHAATKGHPSLAVG